MELAVLVLSLTLCGCVAMFAILRRQTDMVKRVRCWRWCGGCAVLVVMIVVVRTFLQPSGPKLVELVHAFINKPNNCSEVEELRHRLERNGVGELTADQWYHAVGYTVDDLRVHWAFPAHPDERTTRSSLEREFNQRAWHAIGGKYAHRMYGYLLPPTTGIYVFQVSLTDMTAEGTAEFWLSTSADPTETILLTYATINHKKT